MRDDMRQVGKSHEYWIDDPELAGRRNHRHPSLKRASS